MTWGEYLAWSLGNYRNGVEKWEQVRKIVYSTAATMGGLEIPETEFMPLPFDYSNVESDNDEIDIIEYQKQFRNAFS